MEIKPENLNNFETIKTSLIKKIEIARLNALPLEKIKEMEQKINNLENLYFNGKVPEEKFKEEISQLYFEHNRAGLVILNTLPEFHEALKMCDVNDNINQLTSMLASG